jgi:uncharacterized protein YcsI (UPF0317 family)
VRQEMQTWDLAASEVRARIREGEYARPTAGVARGHVQANLVILPSDYAFDFLKFCVRNPKPCPILEVTDEGSPEPSVVAPVADLRVDLPKYRVYENGQIVDEPTDILSYWRDDLVSFLLGCSFTFETALLAAGLHVAHIDQGRNAPMYITNRDCVPSGPFAGPLVVSMRPFRGEEVPLAVTISARYPMMHGAPVHVGNPDSGRERSGNPAIRRPRLDRRRPNTRVLGLRRDASSGGQAGQTFLDDHPQSRAHVRYRPPGCGVRNLTDPPKTYNAIGAGSTVRSDGALCRHHCFTLRTRTRNRIPLRGIRWDIVRSSSSLYTD